MPHSMPTAATHSSQTPQRRPLPRRFNELVIAVAVLIMALYVGWSVAEQGRSVEDKALAEARALNREVLATWNYIDSVQDVINHDADGSYNFKGVYCATAAKSIAEKFTDLSEGYVIRYARTDPRSVEDSPDEFEERAIQALSDISQTEFYEMTDYNGVPALRLASRLTAEESCLQCHGSPRGSLDEIGFHREGMAVGDLAGISSIVVPIENYRNDAWLRTAITLALFLVLLGLTIFVVQRGLKCWVTDPLAQANEKLVQANRELAQANGLREQFLATMSHELRTPLSSIIAFTDLWSNKGGGDAAQQQLVEQVGQNSRVLLRMVNNMIDTARVDAGKYQLSCEEIDLVDELADLRAVMGPLATQKGIDFTTSIAPDVPIITSDWNAIHTILGNLVANALAFTEQDGRVHLQVAVSADGQSLIAQVQDNGCGISPEDQERIFHKFERVHQGDQRSDTVGSGLGLGLSRNLARLLGGDLTVESQKRVGSTFTLTLPLCGKEDHEGTRS